MGRLATNGAHYGEAATGAAQAQGGWAKHSKAGPVWLTAVAVAMVLHLPVAVAAPAADAGTGGAPAAAVDGVVMPAWLERAGMRQPLVPGTVLQQSDRIVTGSNARILLTLPEGSKVKLGENAQLGFDALSARREGGSIFLKSAMNVLAGAFRFTTSVLSKATNHREVDIRLATVTAGIRGTDLWGKQAGSKEIVCLLEGRIEVARDAIDGQSAAPPVVLDQAMQFYVAPKGEPTLPIGKVQQEQLMQWSDETEIAPDMGGTSVSGRWKITFDQQTSFADAMSLYDKLRSQGYAAQFRPDKKAGQRIYLVQLGNLSSEGDAKALASNLRKVVDAEPHVSR